LYFEEPRAKDPALQKITTFLWFDDKAEEAANFYVSLFGDSRIEEISRYGEAGPGPKGTVMTVTFRLAGQEYTALNGGPQFSFTPAISFSVACKNQAEIDELWTKLSSGGKEGRCGWLEDKYGLSWQIVPAGLGSLLKKPGAMKALLGMSKLDIRRLEEAG
jgi:predicted 3-demethylubiquinone-9 3-methyltransferase (glyoxalase superfamily)